MDKKTAPKKSPSAKKHGKKYTEKQVLITKQNYALKEAIDLLIQTSYTKFDSTAEFHATLNADPKYADQIVRATVVLPHGTGKSKRIAAFVTDNHIQSAKEAGADISGHEDLIQEIQSGKINFDIAVAMPQVMKDLGKVAKILGQKGLMPSPKAGTVTENIEETIKEIKKGKIEFRTDKQGIIHSPFGKVSFGCDKLQENLQTLVKAILDAKPTGIKGTYIKKFTITSTMGPGIALDLPSILNEISEKK